MTEIGWFISSDLCFLGKLGLRFLNLDILGKIDQYRTRTTSRSDMEGFLHRPCQVLNILNKKVIFGNGPGNACDICLLKGVIPYQMGGNLTSNSHHGNRVHMGSSNTCC